MKLLEIIKNVLTGRQFLPGCPECKSGRIHKTEEILGKFYGKTGFDHYGLMRSAMEVEKIRESVSCDKCDYKISREYTQ